jgi:hypothetical protein
MDNIEWVAVVLGAIGFTYAITTRIHRREMEEVYGLVNVLVQRLLETELELAVSEGDEEAAEKLAMYRRDES